MKKMIFLGLVLAQAAGLAAGNNVELLSVWNYKTHYESPAVSDLPARIVYTEGTSYFFFSDHSYVKAGSKEDHDAVMRLKSESSGRWMTVGNNLVLLDPEGKQEMAVMAKASGPVGDLLKGEKEINRTITIHSGAVPQVYAETIAFFPKP